MGELKTFFISMLCITASSGPLHAENNLVQSFANCAGRYSAELEHAWLINDPKARDYEIRREGFVSLLDATTTENNARAALSHRVNAKHAHASLLQVATFNSDMSRASDAHKTASRLIERCDLLLLAGA